MFNMIWAMGFNLICFTGYCININGITKLIIENEYCDYTMSGLS